jgi:hypothetical protein
MAFSLRQRKINECLLLLLLFNTVLEIPARSLSIPIILATQEAQIRRIIVQVQPEKKWEILSETN